MLKTGTLLQERFEIVREIGRGGMGAVYEGRDRKFNGTRIAVKECLLTSEPMKRAFFGEASLLAGLEHPYLPDVREHFVEGDGHFLVMKFIEGEDLDALLSKRGEPFSVAEVAKWMDQLLDALDYMHNLETPVIHRDIKPGNIKLTPQNHIKLLDFGLAKGGGTTSISGYSLNFAAPEQLQETGSDARSDLYSLGATMYRLLSGKIPKSAFERTNAILNDLADPLVPVHELNASVPEAVSKVISEAMKLKQKERIPSAVEMRHRLAAALESPAKVEAGYMKTQVNESQYSSTIVPPVPPDSQDVYSPTEVKVESLPTNVSKTISREEIKKSDVPVKTELPVQPPAPASEERLLVSTEQKPDDKKIIDPIPPPKAGVSKALIAGIGTLVVLVGIAMVWAISGNSSQPSTPIATTTNPTFSVAPSASPAASPVQSDSSRPEATPSPALNNSSVVAVSPTPSPSPSTVDLSVVEGTYDSTVKAEDGTFKQVLTISRAGNSLKVKMTGEHIARATNVKVDNNFGVTINVLDDHSTGMLFRGKYQNGRITGTSKSLDNGYVALWTARKR